MEQIENSKPYNPWLSPCFLSQVATGLLILGIVIVLIYITLIKKQKYDNYMMIGLILLLTIAVGIHGVLHCFDEIMAKKRKKEKK